MEISPQVGSHDPRGWRREVRSALQDIRTGLSTTYATSIAPFRILDIDTNIQSDILTRSLEHDYIITMGSSRESRGYEVNKI